MEEKDIWDDTDEGGSFPDFFIQKDEYIKGTGEAYKLMMDSDVSYATLEVLKETILNHIIPHIDSLIESIF